MAGKVTFSIEESMRKLSKDLKDLPKKLEDEVNQAVADTAHAAYASIVAKAQSELNSTRQDYLKGLQFEQIGENSYLITLDGKWPNMIEEGFPSYNQTEVLLRSHKIVEVGRRSGLPWVQHTKPKKPGDPSHKFAYVPIERQPFSKNPKGADMAAAIREMTAVGVNQVEQKITKIFKDPSGNPLEGYVARGRSDNPKLDNLVKYQKQYNNIVQSIYINYRAVSEAGEPWIHPGWKGAHFFKDAEKQIEAQLSKIIQMFFK